MGLLFKSQPDTTVLALFEQQNVMLRDIRSQLDTKAAATDVRALESRLVGLADAVRTLEDIRLEDRAVEAHRRRVWRVVATVATVATTVIGTLAFFFVG
jgi:uncharacterized protein (UPF0147 family)